MAVSNRTKYTLIVWASIIIILIGASLAQAVTDSTQYVNSSCSNNGDGTAATCGSGGGTGAFNSCANWESQNRNLVSEDKRNIVYFSGSAADTTACPMYGWTTDSTRYVVLTCSGANCHTGTWDTGKYRLSVAGTPIRYVKYTRIIGLQIEQTDSTDDSIVGITDVGQDGFQIIGNIVRGAASSRGANARAIDARYADGGRVANNIIYRVAKGIDITGQSGTTELLIANNTIVSSDGDTFTLNRYSGTGNTTVKNNYFAAPTSGIAMYVAGVDGTFTHSNNATGDTSNPDANYRSVSPTFVNSGAGDYHLASGDTGLKDRGVDLSATFATDIDGQTRSGTWDVGADEYQTSGPSLLLLRHAMEN